MPTNDELLDLERRSKSWYGEQRDAIDALVGALRAERTRTAESIPLLDTEQVLREEMAKLEAEHCYGFPEYLEAVMPRLRALVVDSGGD